MGGPETNEIYLAFVDVERQESDLYSSHFETEGLQSILLV